MYNKCKSEENEKDFNVLTSKCNFILEKKKRLMLHVYCQILLKKQQQRTNWSVEWSDILKQCKIIHLKKKGIWETYSVNL